MFLCCTPEVLHLIQFCYSNLISSRIVIQIPGVQTKVNELGNVIVYFRKL